jgi:hypothetical protein
MSRRAALSTDATAREMALAQCPQVMSLIWKVTIEKLLWGLVEEVSTLTPWECQAALKAWAAVDAGQLAGTDFCVMWAGIDAPPFD